MMILSLKILRILKIFNVNPVRRIRTGFYFLMKGDDNMSILSSFGTQIGMLIIILVAGVCIIANRLNADANR